MLSKSIISKLSSIKPPPALFALLLLGAVQVCADTKAHPDFSGTYMPSRETVGFPRELPYTANAKQLMAEFTAEFDLYLDDPKRFCVHPGMPGSVLMRAPFPLEVIQREQDITLFFEGYYQYRKIFIKGHEPEVPPLTSRMGFSVGEWDGDTLVVTTANLTERASGSEVLSEEAEIIEHIKLEKDKDGNKVLAFHLELSDPQTYTEKLKGIGRWTAAPDTHIMEYVCSQTIYEEHLERVRAEKAAAQ